MPLLAGWRPWLLGWRPCICGAVAIMSHDRGMLTIVADFMGAIGSGTGILQGSKEFVELKLKLPWQS